MNATTVSRLTSLAPAAIAVLAIEGPKALEFVSKCWQPNQGTSVLHSNRIRFGFTTAKINEPSIGCNESIVVCRTDHDRVELHCHGGKQASEKILERLSSLGARVIPWNQDPSLLARDTIEQEAIEDLVHANSIRSTAILLDQMRGALSEELKRIELLNATGNLQEAADSILQLRQRFAIGKHLIHPWSVVLAGPPNVGKSSLLNRMLGYDRAIVHEQAGTTRDSLMERTSFDGWPIDLTDGAGVRLASEASDPIEIAGIDLTLQKAREADCVLLMVDPASGWTDSHDRIYQETQGKRILVRSKSDLKISSFPPISLDFDAQVSASSVTGEGTLELQSAIVAALIPEAPVAGTAIPFRQRHIEWLNRLSHHQSTGMASKTPSNASISRLQG